VGTVNVVKATRQVGLDRLIYFQTALCYGTRPLEHPVTLAHPIRPDSSYAISKTAGEQYIELGVPNFLSLRLANAYGPRNVSGPLPTFYRRISRDEPCFVMDTRRDFIYVDDLIDVVMMALEGRGRGHYHVASGSDFAISELFEATVAAMGIELDAPVDVRPRAPDDAYTILLDPTRTNQDFNWSVTTPLVEGVGRAIEWYRAHELDQTYTHLKVPRG
jgi:UDP-glucose 4-epimerase